ncbi:uncharacterized protein KY384_005848 [Bacidia gigantensis]|uniref:uncharacterized protein n=1 Tax=Bacidia gigantensis TaxID=2732470 RepID=UPI001D03CC2D|nr:uncharacterized protein KY384_005848 [Bacidia gigantensis]KAG8529213.1 hypothetical protein KY384_005848 [Bacidia gigantensis]
MAWFPRWLSVEKDFAIQRYNTIVEHVESFELDYDLDTSNATKPTHAAVRVSDLLETITDRYRNLASFQQKVQFLIDVQVEILDIFHSRLRDSLQRYQTLTSTIGRNIQGASREDRADLQGLGGLERLCSIYGSAEYMVRKLRDFNDDVFFIELWDELQYRARQDRGDQNIAGQMSLEDVAERTSSAVGTEEDSGVFFDETAAAFRRLQVKTEEVLQDRLVTSIRDILRPYSRINPWSSLSNSESPSSLAPTAELDATVQYLNENVSFLAKVLAQAALRRIVRQVTLAIQSFLYDNVLLRYVFSIAGVAQYKRDVEVVLSTIDRWVGDGQAQSGMRRLNDALTLLDLPVQAGGGADNSLEKVDLGLWEVEERLFVNNESAREILQELGLDYLSESEARNVLRRRIELSSG